MMFGSEGASASAPTDPVGWPSKIGAHVRPKSSLFQTPPLFGAITKRFGWQGIPHSVRNDRKKAPPYLRLLRVTSVWKVRISLEANTISEPMKRTLIVCLLASAAIGFAQSASTQSQSPAPPAAQAKPEDVNSVEAILAATYDVISGPVGKKRDWDRFRSLFYPGARLIPTGKRANESEVKASVLSPEDNIERSAPFLEKEGSLVHGVSTQVEHSANIV